jgi:exodeoxyribonuclease X
MDEDIKWNMRRELDRRREVYTVAACQAVVIAASIDDLKRWFLDEAAHRAEHRIFEGTSEYDRIVKACADRKKELLACQAA